MNRDQCMNRDQRVHRDQYRIAISAWTIEQRVGCDQRMSCDQSVMF